MPTLLIECGIEGLALRKGDGLRVDLDAGTVHVFRDDDAPALLRGRIPARLTWKEAPSPGQQWKCGDEDGGSPLGPGEDEYLSWVKLLERQRIDGVPARELPDDIRVPLDELEADARYLAARLVNGTMAPSVGAEAIQRRTRAIREALLAHGVKGVPTGGTGVPGANVRPGPSDGDTCGVAPVEVPSYTCLSATTDGRSCRGWCGDPKCAAGVDLPDGAKR